MDEVTTPPAPETTVPPPQTTPEVIPPTVEPSVPAVPVTPPTTPPGGFSIFKMMLFIIGALVIIGIIGAVILLKKAPVEQKPFQPPTSNNTPSIVPTPIRTPSDIATQSAFMKLDSDVTALDTGLHAYSVTDPSLSPPVLTLPLGFSQ